MEMHTGHDDGPDVPTQMILPTDQGETLDPWHMSASFGTDEIALVIPRAGPHYL